MEKRERGKANEERVVGKEEHELRLGEGGQWDVEGLAENRVPYGGGPRQRWGGERAQNERRGQKLAQEAGSAFPG